MAYFLSESIIREAFRVLTSEDIEDPNVFYTFLILKACGYNNLEFKSVDLISKCGYPFAAKLSILFSPSEIYPERYQFINPFKMKNWYSQAPTESLKTYIGGRVKNNIAGGATTWRKYLDYEKKTESIKFVHDYIEIFQKEITGAQKVSIEALSIWINKYSSFERRVTKGHLIQNFKNDFKIDRREELNLFHHGGGLILSFSDVMHNSEHIRTLIGNPAGQPNWINSERIDEPDDDQLHNTGENNIWSFPMQNTSAINMTKEKLFNILEKKNQVLLIGPPGTSKSYLADSVAKEYFENKHTRVQFHPSYSYQEFIGGYVVNKSEVEYRKGVLLKIIEGMNTTDKYLLIIDEINRANVGQVLGEMIQILDRNFETEILINGELKRIKLPENLYIIATMNSSDRSIGSLDHAIRRRFMQIYLPSEPELLLDICKAEDDFSCVDFLLKINNNLLNTLKNKDLVIGHALFLDKSVLEADHKYNWKYENLEWLFNYKILPIIEEYCYGNSKQLLAIMGEGLVNRLSGIQFKEAITDFMKT